MSQFGILTGSHRGGSLKSQIFKTSLRVKISPPKRLALKHSTQWRYRSADVDEVIRVVQFYSNSSADSSIAATSLPVAQPDEFFAFELVQAVSTLE